MSTLQIALAALVVVLLFAWLWLRRRAPGSGAGAGKRDKKAVDRIDTVIGWPPQATRILSGQERLALGLLMRALPDHLILAQVPLARFIDVPKRNSYADWLRRIGYQCVDFVVCDMAAQVIGVVELQAPQLGERARKRLTRITRTLKAAQIPLHLWRENALPSVEAAREALLPSPPTTAPDPLTGAATGAMAKAPSTSTSTSTPTPTPALPPATTPTAAASPFDDAGRDSTQDEVIEPLQPPPSTWFDDLDSDPVPLSKR